MRPTHPEADVPIPVPVEHLEHLINELVSIPPGHGVDIRYTLPVDLSTRADVNEATKGLSQSRKFFLFKRMIFNAFNEISSFL